MSFEPAERVPLPEGWKAYPGTKKLHGRLITYILDLRAPDGTRHMRPELKTTDPVLAGVKFVAWLREEFPAVRAEWEESNTDDPALGPNPKLKVIFDYYTEKYLPIKAASLSTIAHYEQVLREFELYCREQRIGRAHQLSRSIVDGYAAQLVRDGQAAKTKPQDLTSERGKLLRIDPYTGAWEVVAYGFRHPWKWSFDSETGDAWIGDVGDVTFEEVNRIPAGSDVLNFGWPIREATWDCPGCTDDSDPSGITYPVKFYHHYNPYTGITGICAIGGYVYRGSALPWLQGQYVWGDYIGKLWARDDAGTITDLGAMATSDTAFTYPVGFFQDKAGELYVIDLAGADLFKLTP